MFHFLVNIMCRSGSLKAGDILLTINGVSIVNGTPHEAAALLTKSGERITLSVRREATNNFSKLWVSFSVSLCLSLSLSLSLSFSLSLSLSLFSAVKANAVQVYTCYLCCRINKELW